MTAKNMVEEARLFILGDSKPSPYAAGPQQF